jgi:hypothetical protein
MARQLSLVLSIAALAAAAAGIATAQRAANGPNFDAFYKLGPDSLPRDGVPKGEMRGPFTLPSKAYPGTEHTYWIYVPAQYSGSSEVNLMVFNDGATYMKPDGYYRAPNVLDNLTYRGEIPTMLGVFIEPGKFVDGGATNRNEEYNALDDRYARVIVDELLPVLYKDYKVSRDPERHGIALPRPGAPRHRWLEFRGDRRLHGGLGAAGSLPKSPEWHWYLRGPSRRPRLSGENPRQREKTDPNLHDRRSK